MEGLAERRHRRALVSVLVRGIVLAILLPLASAGALPTWARLASVEVHVCHCAAEHHDCVCAKCSTASDDALAVTSETITGRCGDDDVAFGGKALLTVLPAGVVAFVPPSCASHPSLLVSVLVSRDDGPPPAPPPRTAV